MTLPHPYGSARRIAVLVSAPLLAAGAVCAAPGAWAADATAAGPGSSAGATAVGPTGAELGPAYAGLPTCSAANGTGFGRRPGHATVPAVSVTSTVHDDCVLGKGNAGDGVRALQVALRHCFGRTLRTDGIFGGGTRGVLVSVQEELGLTADGVYGPDTYRALSFSRVRGDGTDPTAPYNGHCTASPS